MRLALFAFAFVLLATETANPVHWSFAPSSKKLRSGSKVTLKLQAHIDPGWHMYAMDQSEQGPVPLTIEASEGGGVDVLDVKAAKPVTVYDPNFQKRVSLYADHAEFAVTLSANASSGEPAVEVRYQSCNDRMCLPPRTVNVPLHGR